LVSRFHEQEKVNGLELDVALQKTQEVYEQLLRIKLIPDEGGDKKIPVEVFVPKKIVVEQETKIAKEEPIMVRKAIQPEPEVQQIQPLNEVKPETTSAKPGILADKLGPSNFHPINETLAHQKTGNDLSSKLQTAPLSSISSGIGLNDKFLYIRELFKSDNVLYNNTIKYLDTANSLEEALDFISRNYDWDEKNETSQKFINLIHRRHGNNG
jgi:hypothetical protein